MDRLFRIQHPGSAFHIIARVQGRRPWFQDELEPAITSIIVRGVASSGAALIGHTVSPNHLHIVLVQGPRPLGCTMQPILRRIALLVQKRFNVQGHVFERRFDSVCCSNPFDLLAAIQHTHCDPTNALLCDASDMSIGERAIRIAGRIDSTIDIEELRRPYGTRRATAVRNQLIAALLAARYSGLAIANYLRVSQSTVSRIRVAMWWLGAQNG